MEEYRVKITLKKRANISLEDLNSTSSFASNHKLNRDDMSLALIDLLSMRGGETVNCVYHLADGDNPAYFTTNGDTFGLDGDLVIDEMFIDKEKEVDFLESPFEIGKYYSNEDKSLYGELLELKLTEDGIGFVLRGFSPKPFKRSVRHIIQLTSDDLAIMGESSYDYYEVK